MSASDTTKHLIHSQTLNPATHASKLASAATADATDSGTRTVAAVSPASAGRRAWHLTADRALSGLKQDS